MRPRRAEGPLAATMAEPQLSIFEVDPGSVSTQAAATMEETAAPVWMRAEESRVEFAPQPEPEVHEELAQQAQQRAINATPLNLRTIAQMVDASLTLAAFLLLTMPVISHVGHLPGLRAAELTAVFGMVVVGAAYQALFLVLGKTTPGMMYAGLALTTFDGDVPDRAQRWKRLWATALSIAPLGLGLVWVLFDEDGLMGHDRLSRTYLRRR